MTAIQADGVDGRHLRRDRNRTAVVDALLELYGEGSLAPGADEIAARAGISARSLFRYFDDLDDLARASISRQQERISHLWATDATPEQPLPERIERFVASRIRLLEGMGAVGRVARLRAVSQPIVAAELTRVRRALRRQLEQLFAAELDRRPAAERGAAVAALDVVTSWESHELLRHDQGLSRVAVAATMEAAMAALLRER